MTFRQCSSSWSVLGSCGEDTAAGAAEQPPINNHSDKGPEAWRGATCPWSQQGEAPAGRTGTAARCARWGCANTHVTGGEAKALGALSTGQRRPSRRGCFRDGLKPQILQHVYCREITLLPHHCPLTSPWPSRVSWALTLSTWVWAGGHQAAPPCGHPQNCETKHP